MRSTKLRVSLLAVAAATLFTTVIAQQAPPAAGAPPAGAPAAPQGSGGRGPAVVPDVPPMKVYIYAGPKTHGEGQHDYPQFLADWSKILQNRGANVDGGLHFPSARELSGVDVLVIYKGDAGYVSLEDRANLDQFLRRGGGIVSLHDALCSDDPDYFANIVGGAKKHGQTNFTLEANVPYTIVDTQHPIMQGMTDFKITDEKSLAPAPSGSPYRAFVWMQGHNYSNFALPNVQQMMLRAIAWTGKRPIDTLLTERPQRGNRGTAPAEGAPAAGRGGRGGV